MENRLEELKITEFTALTASDEPAPGGGSVSALAGALAAALGEMVGRLTIGKEKYAQQEEICIRTVSTLEPLREKLVGLITEDTQAFSGYMDALALPKSTDEEKKLRKDAMQKGLKEAVAVPERTAYTAYSVLEQAGLMVENGNRNALTDAMVAAMLARTAVLGAIANVQINLNSIKDEAYVSEKQTAMNELKEKCIRLEAEILEKAAL